MKKIDSIKFKMAAYRPLFTFSHSRYLVTVLDGWTITIKQNVRFQDRMHLEKFRLDQIQNGLLSAIIHFHMGDIW